VLIFLQVGMGVLAGFGIERVGYVCEKAWRLPAR
jgi:hypothetical protein